MIKILIIAITGLLLQGCVSTYKLDPQVQKGQQEVYQEGVETIISNKKAYIAVRSSTNTYTSENRPTIVVSVLNKTNKSFNFSTENIQVFVDGKAHKVFTYDELVEEIKTKQAWAAVATAIGGASKSYNASQAGYSYTTGSYNSYATTNYGTSAYGYGNYSSTTYNYAAAQQAREAANAQTQYEMQNINNQANASLSDLKATILKKTTIPPKGFHGGYVAFENIPDSDKPHDIKVLINVAGQQHKFVFNHFKVKK